MKDYDSSRLAAIASANEIKKIFSISDGLADRYYCKMIDNIIDVLKSSTEKQYKDLTEYEWQQLMLKEFEKLSLKRIIHKYCIEHKTFAYEINRADDSVSTTFANSPNKDTPITELIDILDFHDNGLENSKWTITVEADAFTLNDLARLTVLIVSDKWIRSKITLVAGDKCYDDFLDAVSICNFYIKYKSKEDNNHDN